MTKADRIAYYKQMLAEDPRWAVRGLLRIYAEQTESEKEYEVTAYTNGVGFSGVDAEILTSFAKQFERKGRLTRKQINLVHQKMPKYAGQLVRLTAERETVGA